MNVDAYGVIGRMLRVHALLHPSMRSSRDLTWEMDFDTFDAFRQALPSRGSSSVTTDGAEVQCLGIRVEVVDGTGVRLVIAVTD